MNKVQSSKFCAATMLPADTDDRLTFKEAPGAENTKVFFIEIAEL